LYHSASIKTKLRTITLKAHHSKSYNIELYDVSTIFKLLKITARFSRAFARSAIWVYMLDVARLETGITERM